MFEESGPVQDYQNNWIFSIGTVFSKNRKYIFRRKKAVTVSTAEAVIHRREEAEEEAAEARQLQKTYMEKMKACSLGAETAAADVGMRNENT